MTFDMFNRSLERALPDILDRLKPGANVSLIATFGAYPALAGAVEDAGFDIRDSILLLRAGGVQVVLLARAPLDGTIARNVKEYGVGGLNIDASRVGTDEVSTHSRGVNGAFPKRPGETSPEDSGRVQDQREGLDVGTVRSGRWPANLVFEHAPGCRRTGESTELVGGGAAGTSGFAEGYEPGDGFEGRSVPSELWACETECPVKTVDDQGGVSKSSGGRIGKKDQSVVGNSPHGAFEAGDPGFGDVGGPSRYFWTCEQDCPAEKMDAQSGERPGGQFPEQRGEGVATGFGKGQPTEGGARSMGDSGGASRFFQGSESPSEFIAYLMRLTTPEGGVILDPTDNPNTRRIAESLGYVFLGVRRP